jgi:hypothetical protein
MRGRLDQGAQGSLLHHLSYMEAGLLAHDISIAVLLNSFI